MTVILSRGPTPTNCVATPMKTLQRPRYIVSPSSPGHGEKTLINITREFFNWFSSLEKGTCTVHVFVQCTLYMLIVKKSINSLITATCTCTVHCVLYCTCVSFTISFIYICTCTIFVLSVVHVHVYPTDTWSN